MLPNLFLIGAMRSGTTTLNSMLGQHPDIYIPEAKEPMYYLAQHYRLALESDEQLPEEKVARYRDFLRRGRYRTPHAYKSLYDGASTERYVLDSSHYMTFPQVASLIKRDCLDAKIIVSLRNPAERLYSEYQLYRRNGKVTASFAEWVAQGSSIDSSGRIVKVGEDSRIRKGFYADLLEPWLEVFGTDSVFIVFYEAINADVANTVRTIYRWLELPDHRPRELSLQPGGQPLSRGLLEFPDKLGPVKRKLKKVLSRETRLAMRSTFQRLLIHRQTVPERQFEQLAHVYQSDIARLQDMTGHNLSHWLQPGQQFRAG